MFDHHIKSLYFTLEHFRKSKLRAFMTVFGIMVGIAMVIIVLSAGHGIRGIILDEVASFGDDWINIEVKVPSTQKNSQENASSLARGVTITTLNENDLDAVLKLSNISSGYAGVTTQVVASYKNEKERPTVFGVSASYLDVTKADLDTGRFFNEDEDRAVSQVVVLGSEVKEALFANRDAVGETIKVDGKAFRVVGVMESLGATGFFNMDEIIYIPLRTTQKKIMGVNHVLWSVVQTINNDKAESTAEEIRWLMRERHDITDPDKDDFAITTQAEALSIVGTIVSGITWLLVALAAISLLVGGVGIMNVMYVSVAERTFEVGLRKSVGAREKDILVQFLLEAVVLTALGGVIGILVGGAVSFVISIIAQFAGFAWTFKISLLSIFLAVGFSTAVGILFGVYPAKKAAKLDPIVAIQQD